MVDVATIKRVSSVAFYGGEADNKLRKASSRTSVTGKAFILKVLLDRKKIF